MSDDRDGPTITTVHLPVAAIVGHQCKEQYQVDVEAGALLVQEIGLSNLQPFTMVFQSSLSP